MRQLLLDVWNAAVLITCPARFVRLERRWYRHVQKQGSSLQTVAKRTRMVRRVLFNTGLTVLLATLLGYVAARAVRFEGWEFQQAQQWWMQGGSAALLLWGTLFVRGWDIQTFGGMTLLERANRTIYVGLYFVGTAAAVFGIFVPVQQCISAVGNG